MSLMGEKHLCYITHLECPLQVIKTKSQLLYKAIIQANIEQLPQIRNCSPWQMCDNRN